MAQTYYGLRLHRRVTWPGVITATRLTPANGADSAVAPELLVGLVGWALDDGGYWSPSLRAELAPGGLEPARVDAGQLGVPSVACRGNVLPLRLGRPERLFLRTRPSLLRARHTAATLRRSPLRAASRSAYSASVASFFSATSVASTAAWPPTGTRWRAGSFGLRRSSVRAAFSQSYSVEAATRKRRATRREALRAAHRRAAPARPVRRTGSGHDFLPSNHPQTMASRQRSSRSTCKAL
jgi:hypothetical protein